MRANSEIQLIGNRVILVPYLEKHVPKYHDWMQSEELQLLTASEPLSLAEEYDMQKSWSEDEKKCTFIVLDKGLYQEKNSEEVAMVGDVNLFFNDDEDPSSAEIEIMIAESSCRGKGLGKEAVLCMMRYGVDSLGIKTLTAKIGFQNEKSISMFKKIGFKEVSRSEVFQEVTLDLPVADSTLSLLKSKTDHMETKYTGSEER